MTVRILVKTYVSAANQYHLLPHAWQGPDASPLVDRYKTAFSKAKELYVLNAFLTEWPESLVLNKRCVTFRLIVGTDFGTTKRRDVEAALKWLPSKFKGNIRAFNQQKVNFHPKVVLWREHDDRCYFLVGSSNLTRAAFDSNVEANVTLLLSEQDFAHARTWIEAIERRSVEVNAAWLSKYIEAPPRGGSQGTKSAHNSPPDEGEPPVFDLSLELVGIAEKRAFAGHLATRRAQRQVFDANAKGLLTALFRESASKRRWTEAHNISFFNELCRLWAATHETRMGGLQWVIRGKHSNHQELARSLIAIIDAAPSDRDTVVLAEKDRLHEGGITTRAAVLTELLCHFYPTEYPILDRPVRAWRSQVGFDRGVAGTEGERYVRLALAMRAALEEAGPKNLGLKNLAELDTLIWYLQQ